MRQVPLRGTSGGICVISLSKVGGHKSWSLTLCCRKLPVGFPWLRDKRTLRQALFGGGGAVTLSL